MVINFVMNDGDADGTNSVHISVTPRQQLISIRVSNPVFTETEKPGNPEFFQNRKTGFWLPVNPVFRF